MSRPAVRRPGRLPRLTDAGYRRAVATAELPELFAPPPTVAAHPAVLDTHRLVTEVLEPHATAADDPARGVRREHLDALAAAGLASVNVPVSEGGRGASRAVDLEVVELIAGGCGATWFLLTQHELPQRLARAPLAGLDTTAAHPGPAGERHRDKLSRASTLAGVAVAHLRRARAAVVGQPDGHGGYWLTGRADWCTGWKLLDLLLIAATTPGDRFVFGLIDAAERDGMRAGASLPLMVMGGTATVALELADCRLTADEVLLTVEAPVWRALDRTRTANTRPASLGLLRRVLTELEALGHQRDSAEIVDTALALAHRVVPLRAETYALLDEPPGEHITRRTELRGKLAELTVRAAAALIAARSGSAMLLSSPEQRWAREAAFHLVQAQTAEVRAAQLTALRDR
ncbi:MAG: acyl-CoA/acyl-ACP dehydrogenase [Actinomycetota bacterium]|nr:acyl-CoA/acyl-ACP dehydrogenase [Actinomycetota bacterium]